MSDHLTESGKFKSDLEIDGEPFDWPEGYVPIKIGGRCHDLLRAVAGRYRDDKPVFAADLDAALDARAAGGGTAPGVTEPSGPPAKREWVIERGASDPEKPTYWTGRDPKRRFSSDISRAVRFVRAEDAEAVRFGIFRFIRLRVALAPREPPSPPMAN